MNNEESRHLYFDSDYSAHLSLYEKLMGRDLVMAYDFKSGKSWERTDFRPTEKPFFVRSLLSPSNTSIREKFPESEVISSINCIEIYHSSWAPLSSEILRFQNATTFRSDTPESIRDEDLAIVGQMKSLKVLALTDAGISDDGLQHLGGLSRLESAAFFHNLQIQGEGLPYISSLPQLQKLDIRKCPITDDALSCLRDSNISELSLGGTNVTDKGIAILGSMKQLTTLDIDDTEVTDAAVEDIIKLKALRYLRICRTKITPEGVENIRKSLPRCSIEYVTQ